MTKRKKEEMTNNDLQNTTQKTKRNPTKQRQQYYLLN